MTDASRHLVTLARRVAAMYVAETKPQAILLTGSAAMGESDEFSDLDLIAYYDRLPSPEQLAAARESVQATEIRAASSQETESFSEQYVLQDVHCQVAHLTITTWERDMASVLEEFEPGTRVEKAITGLLDGAALHGGDLIERWQARAATYPAGLVRATVEHHLRFFPLWLVGERWHTRDATIFYYQQMLVETSLNLQMLVETSLNLLAVLAGLNHLYYSSFQFKRRHRFVGKMHLAPERFADRLEGVFALDPIDAGIAMERLVVETVALVEAHMPAVDTAPARRHLGARQRPWHPTAAPASAGN